MDEIKAKGAKWTLYYHGIKLNVLGENCRVKNPALQPNPNPQEAKKKKKHEQMKRAHQFKTELRMSSPSPQRAVGVSLKKAEANSAI